MAIEGFTHLICFAAGHEIIRQGKRDLTLARMTPDVIYDQMVGAGVATKLIFSWLGNPGVGSLHAVGAGSRTRIRRRSRSRSTRTSGWCAATPAPRTSRSSRSELLRVRHPAGEPEDRADDSPYEDGDEVYVVPPLKLDVTIVHAQRADRDGNAQIWACSGARRRRRSRRSA